MNAEQARFRFRVTLVLFIVGLVVSGVTAFPLQSELHLLSRLVGLGTNSGAPGHGMFGRWILIVNAGLDATYLRYPWIAYGTDWLAFGHIVIALFFIEPVCHPAGSRSTLLAGVAACFLVIPLALICGAIREIPFGWRLIDCSFGVFGVLPLLYCLHLQKYLTGAADSA